MTPQQKVNELARKLVDEVIRGPFNSITTISPSKIVHDCATELDWELNKIEAPLVIPNNPPPVEARIGCWLTRDRSKAVVTERVEPIMDGYPFEGVIITPSGTESECWTITGHASCKPTHPCDLLTFISPDVEYWEKEERVKDPKDFKPSGKVFNSVDELVDSECSEEVKQMYRENAMIPELVEGGLVDQMLKEGRIAVDKPKFDPCQLPVSFVVKFPDGKEEGHYTPLRVTEDGIVLHGNEITVFYSWRNLATGIALWSTDRKTWRDFK